MYKYAPLLLLTILTSCFNGKQNEPAQPEKTPTKNDGRFLEYLDNQVITDEEQKKYISNINQHHKVNLVSCDNQTIYYKDEIDGKSVELKITVKPFIKENHEIEYKVFQGKKSNDCLTVDGIKPRGGYYDCPKTEFDKIEFTVDGQAIDLGNHFYNFYNLKMCKIYQENFSPNPLLTYSKDGFFNLYLIGGKGGDSYFVKMICDGKSIVKSYVFDYNQLRDNGGFDKNFIGF